MNRYFAILFLPIIFFLSSCSSSTKTDRTDLSNTDFIYLKEKKFMHKGKEFFPVMINYIAEFRNVSGKCILSPIKEYENTDQFEANTTDSIDVQLRTHFQIIHEIGFNSIRLALDRVSFIQNDIQYKSGLDSFSLKNNSKELLNAISHFLDIAKEFDLKVMVLIKAPIENDILIQFTHDLLKSFTNNPTLFAYDFMNEPLYFDNADLQGEEQLRSKEDAYKIVSEWKSWMNKFAPFQLLTIGFAEPIEVFEWDPEILPVDFVSFHTYNPMRVMNEIYWYSKYVNKPWMIGETSLPADNKINTYDEQREFLVKTFKRVVDCGGAGYGWWQFQEVPASVYEHAYTGMINHDGVTFTKDKKKKMIGTIKPAAFEIENLKKYKSTNPCKQMVNYYNMLGYENIVLVGKILNKTTGKPMEGAVIRGWNENWSVGINTFTNENGIFTLYSNDICTRFEISAPGMTKLKFDYNAFYKPLTKTNLKIENLPNKNREYHNIEFHSLLLKGDNKKQYNSIFNFDSTLFQKAKFKGIMKTLYLEPVQI